MKLEETTKELDEAMRILNRVKSGAEFNEQKLDILREQRNFAVNRLRVVLRLAQQEGMKMKQIQRAAQLSIHAIESQVRP